MTRTKKILLLVVCLLLCIGITYSASAASPLSAKQILLSKLKSIDFSTEQPEPLEEFSGNSSITIKKLNGSLVSDLPFPLAGSGLNLNYKIDIPDKKVGLDYVLALNKNDYKGNIFIDNNNIIFSTAILSLIKEFDPDFNDKEMKDIPQYVYSVDNELGDMWNNVAKSKGQSLPPEFKELLIFFAEGIPEKYFTTSLVNQKITFSLDQEGLEDVIFSEFQKIKHERKRFAALAAGFVTAIDPTQNREDVERNILESIEEGIRNGDFPDSPEEKEQLHLMTELFTLEEFTCEIPLLPSGQGRFLMDLRLGGQSDFTGRIIASSCFTGGSEDFNGTYRVCFFAQEKEENIRVDGQINGQYKHSGVDSKWEGFTWLKVSDTSDSNTLLDIILEANSGVQTEKNFEVNIPVLTEANSAKLDDYFDKEVGLSVYIDGEPVEFEVEPVMVDGWFMVPVKNLAESMGAKTTWIEPDQIDILRGDKLISMYVNKALYTVNGVEKMLEVPPYLVDRGVVMVPLKIIAEELGYKVEYDENFNEVYIYSE